MPLTEGIKIQIYDFISKNKHEIKRLVDNYIEGK